MKMYVMRTLALALALTMGGVTLAHAANAPATGKSAVDANHAATARNPIVTPTKATAPVARGWAASPASSKPIDGPTLAKRVGQGPQPQIVPFSIP